MGRQIQIGGACWSEACSASLSSTWQFVAGRQRYVTARERVSGSNAAPSTAPGAQRKSALYRGQPGAPRARNGAQHQAASWQSAHVHLHSGSRPEGCVFRGRAPLSVGVATARGLLWAQSPRRLTCTKTQGLVRGRTCRSCAHGLAREEYDVTWLSAHLGGCGRPGHGAIPSSTSSRCMQDWTTDLRAQVRVQWPSRWAEKWI